MTGDLAGKELGMTTHGLIPEGLTTTQEVRAIAKLAVVSERTVWRVLHREKGGARTRTSPPSG